jgi:hypothetical protein
MLYVGFFHHMHHVTVKGDGKSWRWQVNKGRKIVGIGEATSQHFAEKEGKLTAEHANKGRTETPRIIAS